ncbi:alpha-ketoglutarate-dependent dioxygenase AlkB [Bernardetia sp. ABR2-2B]|uniref:alpha-ketoglutarate-dependent dioxygenase AlkB family protein n=1 Tax=Bernardetia sp. ABR2-2B TaxID=3127472 RepID=UPI0030D48B26
MDLFNQSSFQDKLPFKLLQKEGYSYSFNKKEKLFIITIPNGKLIFVPHFFDTNLSDEAMSYFLENKENLNWKTTDWRKFEKEKLAEINFENINWTHDQIKIFGKELFVPRFSAWYGDKDAAYSYSGLKLEPNAWNEKLVFIKNKIEKLIDNLDKTEKKTATKFNSVLLNWYRDGQDSMGWHNDNEKELGQNPLIASLNFGATRRFLLRQIDNKTNKLEFSLANGSLLIMAGQIQHFWQHSIPKESKIKENRINLTFRVIK